MVIAVPVSFGIAFFLTEVAPRWLRGPSAGHRTAGRHPSIIYGMWGLFVLVPVMTEYVTRSSTKPWANGRSSARCSRARRSASACSPPVSCWPSWSFRSSPR
jgi:phosphate transport system permease protein